MFNIALNTYQLNLILLKPEDNENGLLAVSSAVVGPATWRLGEP